MELRARNSLAKIVTRVFLPSGAIDRRTKLCRKAKVIVWAVFLLRGTRMEQTLPHSGVWSQIVELLER